jgi:hypothetical protein
VAGSPQDVVDYIPEEAAYGYSWIPFFFVYLLIAMLLVQLTGWRLLLFPPLIAIGIEMFVHSVVCPWAAGRSLILPIAPQSGGGRLLGHDFGDRPAAAACCILIGIGIGFTLPSTGTFLRRSQSDCCRS